MSNKYIEEYNQKLLSADEAAKVVKSGDWIEYSATINCPHDFDEALSKRVDELWDVNIRCDIGPYRHYTLEVDPTGDHFTWNAWHVAGHDKAWIGKTLYHSPQKLHENPMMIRQNSSPANVHVVMTTPMDEYGFFNFGASAVSNWASMDVAQIIIVEENENMPRCLGGFQENIHVSQVDYVIKGKNVALPALPKTEPNDVEKQIASHIIDRMYDGCCLQLGIGGIPNAVGHMVAQSDLKDLGVHSEMYAEAFMEMYLAGKINGSRKNINRFKQVYSFAMGSRALYDFMHDNAGLAAYPIDYVNSPWIIAQIDNMVSINAGLEVDLFSQVCSESVGTRHISGTGGQLDFVEGAYKSKGGQSFICLPSVADVKGQRVSKIQATLTQGAIVTDPRTATHMIVTEYGIADVKGKSTWQRAEALINIAHPDFRDQLIEDAKKMNIWRKVNRIV